MFSFSNSRRVNSEVPLPRLVRLSSVFFRSKNLLSRMNIDPSSGIIDEGLIFGKSLQAGAGQAPARQVAIGAGLPVTTPALTINKVCGSSLKAVMLAANAIRSGEHSCIIAGGMESMTNAPNCSSKARRSQKQHGS